MASGQVHDANLLDRRGAVPAQPAIYRPNFWDTEASNSSDNMEPEGTFVGVRSITGQGWIHCR